VLPMSPTTSGQRFTDRFRAADNDAAREAFDLYAERLRRLARRHLHRRIRQKVDAEDIVQSAYRSFFTRAQREDWNLAGWNEVWGLLMTITLRKCANRAEHYLAARRDVRREVAFSSDSPHPASREHSQEQREPTPDEAAILAETVEDLFRRVGERDGGILAQHLQGYSVVEISHNQGRAERTVRRVLARIRRELEQISGHDE
jgi:RNA polymerase sigma-70 factor, ECF subfamily